MATDYATTPNTAWGKVIFGVGCGLITVLIRVYGSYPEGVSFRDSSFWSALSEVLSVLPHPESIPAVRAVANNTAKTLRFIFISPPYQIPKTPVPAFSGELFTLPL